MERFDNFYINIAREAGSIENLLDSFFSFMARRTDFYYECEPNDNMGFPPGIAEVMVVNIFRKYQNEHYKKHPKKSPEEYQKKLNALKQEKEKTKTTLQTQEIQQPVNKPAPESLSEERVTPIPKVDNNPTKPEPQQTKKTDSQQAKTDHKEYSDIRSDYKHLQWWHNCDLQMAAERKRRNFPN